MSAIGWLLGLSVLVVAGMVLAVVALLLDNTRLGLIGGGLMITGFVTIVAVVLVGAWREEPMNAAQPQERGNSLRVQIPRDPWETLPCGQARGARHDGCAEAHQ